jgi:polar amino acid transport system substrate-binding protein
MMPSNIERVASGGAQARRFVPAGALKRIGACLFALGLAAPAWSAEALTLCFENVDVRPWRTVDGAGLNFELLKAAAQRLQLRLDFKALPWKRCLAMLQANEVDGAFAASFAPERLEVGVYPGGKAPDAAKRMHVDRYVLLRRKGDSVGWDGRAFQNLNGAVGSQLGYSIGAQLRAMGVAVDEGSQDALSLVRKLMAGRLAAAALGGSDATRLLAGEPWLAAQVEVLPAPLTEKPYFLMLSHAFARAAPESAARLWGAIEEARNSPAYRKIEKETLENGIR